MSSPFVDETFPAHSRKPSREMFECRDDIGEIRYIKLALAVGSAERSFECKIRAGRLPCLDSMLQRLLSSFEPLILWRQRSISVSGIYESRANCTSSKWAYSEGTIVCMTYKTSSSLSVSNVGDESNNLESKIWTSLSWSGWYCDITPLCSELCNMRRPCLQRSLASKSNTLPPQSKLHY